MKYIDYPNHEEWFKGRINSLGASEVASALGMGFQTPIELWKVKTGRVKPKDLSENERVKYGTEAENYLRALFVLKMRDKYFVEYFPYRVYYRENLPYLTATLDGELIRLSDGKKGVWECKTVWVTSAKILDDWSGRIPDKYYIQVCEQLGITGYDFAVVTVELIFPDGDSEIRNISIERTEQVERDIQYVETEAVKWWDEYVVKDKQPPVRLTI